jgi:hypothetical protein
MTKLTDDDLGDLLRETFTEKETLADHLPAATRRRRTGPVLLAAAVVLAVVAGVLYGVNRVDRPRQTTPAATITASDDADIWAAALTAMARRFEPSSGWHGLVVLDLSDVGKDHVRKGPDFSTAQKERIAATVGDVAPVEWDTDITSASCRNRQTAQLQVGDIVNKGDHQEVLVSISSGCLYGYGQTYRVEKRDGVWVATGTVGPGTGTWPALDCLMTGKSPASPQAGC